MENNEISKESKRKRSVSAMSDEIDFDNITFRPITQGLGFHPEKKEIPIIKSRTSVSHVPTRPLGMRPTFTPSPRMAPNPIQQRPRPPEVVLEEVQMPQRLMAFFIDLLIILMATGLTLSILGFGSGLNLDILLSILSLKEIILFTTGVFTIYFLFYFSILDLSTTVGKSLMGMEVKMINGGNPVLKDTFSRSLLTLVFLPLLGIPTLAEIQEKLSETKIYKK